MRFNYVFSIWDYDEALRLHRRQKARRLLCFLLLYRIVPFLSLTGLVLLGASDIKAHTLPAWILLSFAIALLWIGILAAFIPRENARRGFRRSALAGQTTINVDGNGVVIQVPGVRETKMFWAGFVAVAQNDKLLLLYTSKNCFLVFPTSAMALEQRVELSATIDRNLTRK